MKSRANFKAHPLHPAIVPFPFAFLAGAALFDAAAMVTGNSSLSVTAAHLTIAGLGAGVVAAVPGVVDYVYSVPPGSSGKQRATRHAIGNTTALALFALAFALRRGDWIAGPATTLVETAGLVVLGYAGWLGGTLVTRNLIGVDHRYARSGKWSESTFDAPAGEEVAVARDDELEDGQMKLLHVNGRRIALARTGERFHAIDDGCSHRGGSLAAGVLVGTTVHCLWHGSQFDVRSGETVCGPAKTGVGTYPVRRHDGTVLLTIPKKL